jgi:glycosyltransferase involved in cell wall biosynthesis
MIRPSSSRRSAELTMQILAEIKENYQEKVSIVLFGADKDDNFFKDYTFAYNNLGKQTSAQLALLFNKIDIFVDFSTFQAMGLTAMEAIACGVAVIVPQAGGANSFAKHRKNALIIDTSCYQACYTSLNELINNYKLRRVLISQAFKDIMTFYPEKTTVRTLKLLFDG